MNSLLPSLLLIVVFGSSPASHAKKRNWKHTFVGRLFCEADGECDRSRIERKREAAARAEEERDQRNEQLEVERQALADADETSRVAKQELAQARAEIGTRINAISGRLDRIQERNRATRENLDELMAENETFTKQAKTLEAAFVAVNDAAPALLAGLSSQGQKELKEALVSYSADRSELPDNIKQAADSSAELIDRRSRKARRAVEASLGNAQIAYRALQKTLFKEGSDSGQTVLREIRNDVDSALQMLTTQTSFESIKR